MIQLHSRNVNNLVNNEYLLYLKPSVQFFERRMYSVKYQREADDDYVRSTV